LRTGGRRRPVMTCEFYDISLAISGRADGAETFACFDRKLRDN